MPAVTHPSLARRFAILLAISLAGVVALAVAAAVMMSQAGIHGQLYHRIRDAQDLTSDIEPPPLYLVEAMLAAHEIADAKDPAPLVRRFAELRLAFEGRIGQWRARLELADELQCLDAIEAPARRFLDTAERDFLPAVAASDSARALAVLDGPLTDAFEEHRLQVVRFMGLLQVHRAEAESRAHAVEIAGGLGMLLLLGGLLAAARGLLLVRRGHEREIREREVRFRYLSEATFEGIVVTEQGILVDANQQYAQMLGYADPAPLLGKPVSEWIASESRSAFLARIADASEEDFEVTMIRADGSRIEIEARPRYFVFDGRRRRMTALRDITQHKRIQNELLRYRDHLEERVATRTADLEAASLAAERLTQEAEEERRKALAALEEARHLEASYQRAKVEAETANRAKSDFLARMSHEIRTPLNAVLGYAQMLVRDRSLATEQRRSVEVINRSGEHLLSLISDILEMSRIEAGRTTVEAEDFDLPDLLDNLKSLFLLRAQDKGLALSIEPAPGLPRHIRTDQRKLRQILVNLLSNAVKFSDAGTIRVVAALDAGRLRLAIHDNGPGIASEEQAGLFQPFAQSESGRRRSDGSGLGLAISRGFAQILGGSLGVDSRPGNGSSFILEIPVTIVDGMAGSPAGHLRVRGLAPGQAAKVLIAEDHGDSRALLHRLLESMGLEVRSVGDGAAAVAACRQWEPQLVWMDVDMPVLDGLGAARAIRAAGTCRPVIIALTAAAFAEDRQRIIDAGCDDVAHKPYREEVLFRLMERHLGLRFLWEDGQVEIPAAGRTPVELRAGIGRLSERERLELREAVVLGDLHAVADLTHSWGDLQLAAAVRHLSEAMALERLADLVAPATGDASARVGG